MLISLARRIEAEGLEVAAGCILIVGAGRLQGFNSSTGRIVRLEEADPSDASAIADALVDEGILVGNQVVKASWSAASQHLPYLTTSPHLALEHLREQKGPITFATCGALLYLAGRDPEQDSILLDRFLANLPDPLPSMYASLLSDDYQLMGALPSRRLIEESRRGPLPTATAVLEEGTPWDSSSDVGPIRPASQVNVWPKAFVHVGTASVARHLSRLDDPPIIASGISMAMNDARAKAIGEAYERYAAGIVTRDLAFEARASEDERCLSPDEFISFIPRQLKAFPELAEFRCDEERVWVRARFASGGECAVLADLVFYPLGSASAVRHATANSSGMAAAVDQRDAVERAWAELLERHCFMRTWLGKLPAPRIDFGTNRLVERCADDLKGLGWDLHLFQIAEHEREAVVLAIAIAEERVSLGCAAGTEPARTLEKAVEEAWSGVVLADESEGSLEVSTVRTPSDHRRLYRWGEHADQLSFLLDADDWVRLDDLVPIRGIPDDAIVIGWPSWLTNPLRVVRVMHPQMIPITFGLGREPLGRCDVQALVGPDSPWPAFPHPFP
jgi:ribosomal protein S12 methylthiotransferase accessory factor